MATPLKLFLVRHGLSEANLDKTVNARLPDNQVPLAEEGHRQARAAGDFLSLYLQENPGRTRILCSPYRRTRETSAGIEERLAANDIPFTRREELALREISFGLFDGIEDDQLPEVYPLEHAHYKKYVDFEGEFYAPMPMGESRVQVADRVKSVFGTILRDADADRKDRIQNFIIVSHGVTIRAFIMQWLHYTPEWYQEQKNPLNCSVNLIQTNNRRSPSDGEPYEHKVIFPGFANKKHSPQQEREEGHIDTHYPPRAGGH